MAFHYVARVWKLTIRCLEVTNGRQINLFKDSYSKLLLFEGSSAILV